MNYLGVFHQGEILPLAVTTLDAAGEPAWPQAPPVATIRSDSGAVVAEVPLTVMDRFGVVGLFGWDLLLGSVFMPGDHMVEVRYQTDLVRSEVGRFEVLTGGSPSGSVLSMIHYKGPRGRHLVYHDSSGEVQQGRNPR